MVEQNKESLIALYRVHSEWSLRNNAGYVCCSGCATCCTESVSISSLEGQIIHDFLTHINAKKMFETLLNADIPEHKPRQTTNSFAAQCINKEPLEEEESWSLTPCIFLDNDRCSIYPIRPFVCRSMVSERFCRETGYAVIPPTMVTINSIIMQIIEHIDRGQPWGNMITVLQFVINNKMKTNSVLLQSKPVPGFLVPSEEQPEVDRFFAFCHKHGVSIRNLLKK